MSATLAPPLNTHEVSTTDRPPKRFDPLLSSDVARLRTEYIEIPGLALTVRQTSRLCGVGAERSAELLAVLLEGGFLVRDQKGRYRRRR